MIGGDALLDGRLDTPLHTSGFILSALLCVETLLYLVRRLHRESVSMWLVLLAQGWSMILFALAWTCAEMLWGIKHLGLIFMNVGLVWVLVALTGLMGDRRLRRRYPPVT